MIEIWMGKNRTRVRKSKLARDLKRTRPGGGPRLRWAALSVGTAAGMRGFPGRKRCSGAQSGPHSAASRCGGPFLRWLDGISSQARGNSVPARI